MLLVTITSTDWFPGFTEIREGFQSTRHHLKTLSLSYPLSRRMLKTIPFHCLVEFLVTARKHIQLSRHPFPWKMYGAFTLKQATTLQGNWSNKVFSLTYGVHLYHGLSLQNHQVISAGLAKNSPRHCLHHQSYMILKKMQWWINSNCTYRNRKITEKMWSYQNNLRNNKGKLIFLYTITIVLNWCSRSLQLGLCPTTTLPYKSATAWTYIF